MSNDEIEKFLAKQQIKDGQQVKIVFKKRNTLYGIFIKGNDYVDLKRKNFWRIVTSMNFEAWSRSKDINFARIFNGSEFSSLAVKDI
ncbi:MAG TPA: hypothetical protein VG738_00500 [Chitinophagaceae bacterium]|nr:hypothetical protein [Chitinophagaceae bacterium]